MDRLTNSGTKEAKNFVTMQEIVGRLSEYEDTGLTPEKILEMDRMYRELGEEVMKYRKIGTVSEVKSMGKYSRLAKNMVLQVGL